MINSEALKERNTITMGAEQQKKAPPQYFINF
jgi:hypothetical protein